MIFFIDPFEQVKEDDEEKGGEDGDDPVAECERDRFENRIDRCVNDEECGSKRNKGCKKEIRIYDW